jgi:hypothetical protein
MFEQGSGKDYDFKVNLELYIDEKRMSEGELALIQRVMPDLFRIVLDDQMIEEE